MHTSKSNLIITSISSLTFLNIYNLSLVNKYTSIHFRDFASNLGDSVAVLATVLALLITQVTTFK